mgnify:CR=1 FL=1|jgi:hypothetical protein|tara:strand:+ start:40 stop:375 length:336 start_codon:yes stop_codon:yes gene_type:complete
MYSYLSVENRETGVSAFKITSGKFDGVVWNYKSIKMPMYDNNGDLIEIEKAEKMPLIFDYDLLYNKEEAVNEKSRAEFHGVIGDILMDILEQSLNNDKIRYNTESGNGGTE